MLQPDAVYVTTQASFFFKTTLGNQYIDRDSVINPEREPHRTLMKHTSTEGQSLSMREKFIKADDVPVFVPCCETDIVVKIPIV